jgi:hypothetical protein
MVKAPFFELAFLVPLAIVLGAVDLLVTSMRVFVPLAFGRLLAEVLEAAQLKASRLWLVVAFVQPNLPIAPVGISAQLPVAIKKRLVRAADRILEDFGAECVSRARHRRCVLALMCGGVVVASVQFLTFAVVAVVL